MSRPVPTAILVFVALLGAVTISPAAAQTLDFSDAALGQPPARFSFARTGSGPQGRWEIGRDDSAAGGRALAQLSADSTDYRFPLAIYEAVDAADVEISARFKPVSGKVDRAGGVVLRYQNPDNYYVARANALEGNVRFYRVLRGKREQLAGADTKITTAQWHTLALRAEGDRFAVSLDGRALTTTKDGTFGGAGKVGLWTKADSVTHFDKIEIKILR